MHPSHIPGLVVNAAFRLKKKLSKQTNLQKLLYGHMLYGCGSYRSTKCILPGNSYYWNSANQIAMDYIVVDGCIKWLLQLNSKYNCVPCQIDVLDPLENKPLK